MFAIAQITQISADILRVEFNDFPKASDDSETNDALNALNYTLAGPGNNAVVLVHPVSANSKAVDLFLSLNILPDTLWDVTIANIQDIFGNTLATETFQVVGQVFNAFSVTNGTENETAEQYLRRYLNPALKGSTWNALLAAIGTNEQANWDNAKAAFDQLFRTSASGPYLKDRGADFGVTVPYNVAFTDDEFRKYIDLIANHQLTLSALNDLLEIFYGVDSTHATSVSNNAEPFNVPVDSQLFLEIDGQFEASLLFTTDYFTDNTQATALEVATAISEQLYTLGVPGYALSFTDPDTGEVKVKLFSKTAGVGSKVTVLGGEAQNHLRFDEFIDAYPNVGALPTWTITSEPDQIWRFTTTTDPTSLDLSLAQPGDYVSIFDAAEFNDNNVGTYIISAVSVTYGPLTQYFEITNTNGTAEVVAQLSVDSVQFYRPIAKTIYSLLPIAAAYAVQTGDQKIDIVLPATPASVRRQELTGAYLQDNDPLDIAAAYRSFLSQETLVDLNVSAGAYTGQVLSENFVPILDTPTITPKAFGTQTDMCPASFWSAGANLPVGNTYRPKAVRFATGVGAFGGSVLWAGGENALGVAQSISVYSEITAETDFPDQGRRFAYTYNNSSILLAPRKDFGLTTAYGGEQALLTGGRDNLGTVSDATWFYAFPGGWSDTTVIMSVPRSNHAQVEMQDGNIMVAGGQDNVATPLTDVEIFQAFGNYWVTAGSLNLARENFTLITLNNGKVLAIGGRADTTCELYDPLTDTWSFTGNRRLLEGASKSLIFKLRDGRVIAVGGDLTSPSNGESFPGYTEIYDPATGFWYDGPKMITHPDFEVVDIVGGMMDNDGTPNITYTTIDEINHQTIICFAKDPTGDIYTQYLEPVPIFNLLQYPELRWRPGPVIASADAIKDGVFMWADGAMCIYAYGLIPGTNNLSNKSVIFIKNSDRWGYVGPGFALQKGTFTAAPDVTLLDNEVKDFTEFTINEAIATPLKAEESDGIKGPYIWSPQEGPAIVDPETTLTADYFKGNTYSILDVTSTAGFPAEGYVVINFALESGFYNGTAPNLQIDAIFPVKYIAVVNATQLLLEPGFMFKADALVGSSVSLLLQKEPYDPESGLPLGSFYLTDTPAARVAAQKALDIIEPAGPEINEIVVYPGDRGLGGEGYPTVPENDLSKVSDVVEIWAGSQDETDVK